MNLKGSEKNFKKSSKTRVSDWDMDVQGPGFDHGFDHVLGSFLKTNLKKYHRFGPDPPPAKRTKSSRIGTDVVSALGWIGVRLSTPGCKEVLRARTLQGVI